jgi:hypothetical protein
MDARTLLLTANTETVYAIGHLDLRADGPTVIEAPPHMLGFCKSDCSDTSPISVLWALIRAMAASSSSCPRLPRECSGRVFRLEVTDLFSHIRHAQTHTGRSRRALITTLVANRSLPDGNLPPTRIGHSR